MHDSQIPESPFEPPLESDYDESTVPIIPFEDISNVPPAQPSAELLSSYGLPPNIDLATFLSSPGVVEDLLRLLAQGGVSNTLPLPILQALLAQTNVLMQTQNKPTFPTQPSLINIPSQSNYLSPTNNFISQPISNSSVPYFSQSVPFVPSINPSTNPLANRVPNNLPSPNLNFPNNLPYGLNFLPRTQPPQIQVYLFTK